MRERALGYACVVAVVTTLFTTGVAGIDFGKHWDEWYEVEGMKDAINFATVADPPPSDRLQFIYYGMYYLPGRLVVLAHVAPRIPEAINEIGKAPRWPWSAERYPALVALRTEALALIETNDYKLQYRSVFLAISALAPLFVFFAMLELAPKRYLIAAAASAFVGLSFEFATHARWPAADGEQTAMMALLLWLIARALKPRTRYTLALNFFGIGIAAGLVFACKATGLIALVPAVVTPWFCARTFPKFGQRLFYSVAILAIALAVFVLLEPRIAIDPFRLINTVNETRMNYSDDNLPNSVDGPLDHALRVAGWVWIFVGSPARFFSIALAFVALMGSFALARREPRFTIVAMLWAMPLLFMLLRQPLMVTRNYLQFLPLLALAFGMGLVWFSDALEKQKSLRDVLAVALAVVFVFNASSLAHAAWTIRTYTAQTMLDDTAEYLKEQEYDLYMSPKLHRAIGERIADVYECRPQRREDAATMRDPRVSMYYADHDWRYWISNRIDFVEYTAAPRTANLHYNACWLGFDEELRTVTMKLENAEEMRVPVRTFLACRHR
jgi:MFS family permease